MRKVGALLSASSCLALPSIATAHAGETVQAAYTWQFDPLTVLLLLLSAFLYVRGVTRLWHNAGKGRGLQQWRVVCYAAGWTSLAIALVSPIHTLGSQMFWMHMLQHEILMLVSAPLIVLSKPMLALSWGLPKSVVSSLYSSTAQLGLRRLWKWLRKPLVAWSLHAIALWGWHMPYLFTASVEHEWFHALQHFSFFGSALLFTYALVEVKHTSSATTIAIAYLFTTSIHTSILGVLLAFGHTIWYPVYGLRMLPWGMSALEDQQLGGLIMWIPGGVVYLVGALLFGYRLLKPAVAIRTVTHKLSID
jgi:putative membrane protein